VTVARVWTSSAPPGPKSPAHGAPVPLLSVGSPLELPDVVWASHALSVVLLLDTNCRACNSGAEFYAELARLAGRRADTRFLVLSVERTAQVRKWLDDRGIQPVNVVRILQIMASQNIRRCW
jgi:hypothetical protein